MFENTKVNTCSIEIKPRDDMKYGMCLEDGRHSRFKKGDVYKFYFRDGYTNSIYIEGEKGPWSFNKGEDVEITKSEYDRCFKQKIHPIIDKAFNNGDFGCQEDSVRNLLVAITEAINEKK